MWFSALGIWDALLKNYVTFAFDFGAIVSNLIGIVTLRKAAKKVH